MRALALVLVLLVPAVAAASASTWWEAYQGGQWRPSSSGGSLAARDADGRVTCAGQPLRRVDAKFTGDGPCVLRVRRYRYHCVAIEGAQPVTVVAPADECLRLCERGEPQRVACE